MKKVCFRKNKNGERRGFSLNQLVKKLNVLFATAMISTSIMQHITPQFFASNNNFAYSPPATISGNPTNCNLDGSMTFYQCFSDPAWADAVAAMAGKTNGNMIFTQTDADNITIIDGKNDIAPFIYRDDETATVHMPKMDGLGLFINLKRIENFSSGSEGLNNFAQINWTDEGITPFDKWGEATSLEVIKNINFSNGALTTIDLTAWGDLANLQEIETINFNNNKLTTIGNLTNWSNLSNLQILQDIQFNHNQLTEISDLDSWVNLNVTEITGLRFNNNQLIYVPMSDTLVQTRKIEASFDNQNVEGKKIKYVGEQLPETEINLTVSSLHSGFHGVNGTYGATPVMTQFLTEKYSYQYKDETLETYGPLTSPYTLVLPLQLDQSITALTYHVEQFHLDHSYSEAIISYSATVKHPLLYNVFSLTATDFTIYAENISDELATVNQAISLGGAEVEFVDEFNTVSYDKMPTVNEAQLLAIQEITLIDDEVIRPLTFNFTHEGVTIEKTINVTILSNNIEAPPLPPEEPPVLPPVESSGSYRIHASNFTIDIADFKKMYSRNNLSNELLTHANASVEDIESGEYGKRRLQAELGSDVAEIMDVNIVEIQNKYLQNSMETAGVDADMILIARENVEAQLFDIDLINELSWSTITTTNEKRAIFVFAIITLIGALIIVITFFALNQKAK